MRYIKIAIILLGLSALLANCIDIRQNNKIDDMNQRLIEMQEQLNELEEN